MVAAVQDGKVNISARTEASKELYRLSNQDHFSFQELLSAVSDSILTGETLQALPATINVSPLGKIIEKLSSQTESDGLERGRYSFLDLNAKRLVLGKTSLGTEDSVEISKALPEGTNGHNIKPFLVLHTHANNPISEQPAFHFSEEDLRAFLQDRDAKIDIVIVNDKVLIAIKYAQTIEDTSDKNISAIFKKAEDAVTINGNANDWTVTQAACLEMGIGLYAADIYSNYIAININPVRF